jgi:hypothetical protein
MTLGPVWMVVHAPNSSSATRGETRNNLVMIESSGSLARRRLRRHALPIVEPVNVTVPAFVSLAFDSAAIVAFVRSARLNQDCREH